MEGSGQEDDMDETERNDEYEGRTKEQTAETDARTKVVMGMRKRKRKTTITANMNRNQERQERRGVSECNTGACAAR